MDYYVRKTSGEKQKFDLNKLRVSLQKAGVAAKHIVIILHEIKKQKPRTTNKVHALVTSILEKEDRPVAGRYNLKRALMELGPSGYPFERFFAHLLREQKYTADLNQRVAGACVEHEVDVVAHKKGVHYMIECKFHNRPGLKSDVKVALYIYARFEDIKEAWESEPNHIPELHQAWIVTNTQFTTEALKFARCRKIKATSWSYPQNNSLASMIENLGLHPITVLTSLSRKQKQQFIRAGFVLCRDAHKNKEVLKKLGFSAQKIARIVKEAEGVCQL